jgi:hypothetical protein
MRFAPRALVAGGLGFAVSLIAACGGGGSGLLSSAQASSLSSQIQQVRADLHSGDCNSATSSFQSVAQEIQNLPSSVNATLRANLSQGAATAQSLLQRQCGTTTTSTSTTRSATTTSPTTTASTPTQTQTTTTSTATTTTPAGTTTTGPGSGGAGLGGDNGSGNGGVPGNGNGHGN